MRKTAKISGRSYKCLTGYECKGFEEGTHGVPKGNGESMGTHAGIKWPLVVEWGAGGVNSDPWGSVLCNAAFWGETSN